MPKHPGESMLSQLTGSILPGRARHKPRAAGSPSRGQNKPTRAPVEAQEGQPQPTGSPIRLNGQCSCGRERRDVTIPGIEGDRWFRSVFTQCECGEVLLLTPARAERD